MKNKTSFYIVIGLIFLAAIGIVSKLVSDPVGLIKMIAGMALVVAVIFFLIKRFSQASPSQNHEQRAFKKAAKRSKKRFHSKDNTVPSKRPSIGSLSAARKKRKDASHLTVIEGKKGKKKNRASF